MPIPRHKSVKKTVTVVKQKTHSFEFHRDDLVKLLRLPENAKLTVVEADKSIEINGSDGVLFAVVEETK
jgi:hypothetical protein